MVEFCEELYASGIRSPYLLAFLIDIYQEKHLSSGDDQGTEVLDSLEKRVIEMCNQLITTHDVIRAKYWDYILQKFKLNVVKSREEQKCK